MNSRLKDSCGKRLRVTAKVGRFGALTPKGKPQTTIVLRNVRDAATSEILCSEMEFRMTTRLGKSGLRQGDRVEFDATVESYLKGPKRYQVVDYRLVDTRRIKVTFRPWVPVEGSDQGSDRPAPPVAEDSPTAEPLDRTAELGRALGLPDDEIDALAFDQSH